MDCKLEPGTFVFADYIAGGIMAGWRGPAGECRHDGRWFWRYNKSALGHKLQASDSQTDWSKMSPNAWSLNGIYNFGTHNCTIFPPPNKYRLVYSMCLDTLLSRGNNFAKLNDGRAKVRSLLRHTKASESTLTTWVHISSLTGTLN